MKRLISLELLCKMFICRKGNPHNRLPSKKNYKPYTLCCCFCGQGLSIKDYTKEHLIPQCKFGNDSEHNVKPCCLRCNQEKGNMDIFQYVAYLEKRRAPQYKINNAMTAFYGSIWELLV